jgi:nucleotide-binding universal stress UspA family protein
MKRILVAYDGSEPARRALDVAIDLAKRYDALVSVVSVIPIVPGRTPNDPWEETLVHAGALREARAILAEHGIEAELLEPSGDPARTIEKIVEIGRFDTVVVGSRGIGPVSGVLQGSVSEHVAVHAEATVVIAR